LTESGVKVGPFGRCDIGIFWPKLPRFLPWHVDLVAWDWLPMVAALAALLGTALVTRRRAKG
jgi:hypothetical protein